MITVSGPRGDEQAAGFKAPQGQREGGVDAIPCTYKKKDRGQDKKLYRYSGRTKYSAFVSKLK